MIGGLAVIQKKIPPLKVVKVVNLLEIIIVQVYLRFTFISITGFSRTHKPLLSKDFYIIRLLKTTQPIKFLDGSK